MLSLAKLYSSELLSETMPLHAKIDVRTGQDLPVWVLPKTLQPLAESGDRELVEELIGDFLADGRARLEVIVRAIAGRDYRHVNLEAHTVKGSALQLGAARLADACYRLEFAAKQSAPDDLMVLYREVSDCFEEVSGVMAVRPVISPPGGFADGNSHYGE